MKIVLLAALISVVFPAILTSQIRQSGSVCSAGTRADDDVILTFCNHEHGMAPIPQPRLYFRLHIDGRAEYETDPPYHEGNWNREDLITKKFKVPAAELDELRALLRAADFREAKALYPAYRMWDDSSLETTLIATDQGVDKKIVLKNFSTADDSRHYPPSLFELMKRIRKLVDEARGIPRAIPSITFCELMKDPKRYLNQKVSLYAVFEHSALLPYFHDDDCTLEITGFDIDVKKIGVRYGSEDPEEREEREETPKHAIQKIRERPFYGRADASVTGILREERAEIAVFTYSFAITSIQKLEPILVAFQGTLEPRWQYADTFDVRNANVVLSQPLVIPPHHAVRIEWTNEAKFPALRTRGRKYITFLVVSRDITKIDANRWNTTYRCEILSLKTEPIPNF